MWNWTADTWVAISQLGTLIVAGVAALFARHQVLEARRIREDQARPFVIVDIQPGPGAGHLLHLVVENIGTTAAQDVHITFDPPLEQSNDSGYPLAESVLVREGIRMLPPGRCIRAFFDAGPDRLKTDLPMRYDVTVMLKDARGRPEPPQQYVLDLGYLFGLTAIHEFGIHDAAKAITEIQKSVKRWSDIHGRLKVWIRDEDRRDLEDQVEHDLTGRWPSLGNESPSPVMMALGRNVFVRALMKRFRQRQAVSQSSD